MRLSLNALHLTVCGLMFNIVLTNQAAKDARKLEQPGLKPNAAKLLKIIRQNSFQNPPLFRKKIKT